MHIDVQWRVCGPARCEPCPDAPARAELLVHPCLGVGVDLQLDDGDEMNAACNRMDGDEEGGEEVDQPPHVGCEH